MAKAGGADPANVRVDVLDLMCYTPEYDRLFVEALSRINPTTRLTAIDFARDPQALAGARLERDTTIADRVNRWRLPKVVKLPLKGIEYLVNLRRLARRLVRDGTQVVHLQWSPYAHMLPFDHHFLEHLKDHGVKTVHTVHNVSPHDGTERQKHRYERLYHIPDALICHTDQAKRRVVEEYDVPAERVWVIPHGPMDHTREPPPRDEARAAVNVPKDRFVVLMFGNLRPYKGAAELLSAWSRIEQEAPQALLLIAGGADRRQAKALSRQVADAGLDAVRLELGWVDGDRMLALHAASDLLVYPYRGITQSGALVAGMRFGLPVVATALPGFQALLEDVKTGRLVPPRDPDALAQAILEMVQDPKRAGRQGREVRRRWEKRIAKDASWDAVAKKALAVYRHVLKEDTNPQL